MFITRLSATFLLLVLLMLCLSICSVVRAEVDIVDESSQFRVSVLAESLDNPCGLTLRPRGTGNFEEVYFSESGAGRVLALSSKDPKKLVTVIEGFPTGPWELDPKLNVGPLGLAFIKRTRLAVGTGGLGREKDHLRTYDLPTSFPQQSLNYEKKSNMVGPLVANKRTAVGESGFYALALMPGPTLYSTSTGDKKGWLSRSTITSNSVDDLQTFVAAGQKTDAMGLLALTFNPARQQGYLVAGLRGEPGEQRDSVLAMFSPTSGRLALKLQANLHDLTALAYSATGQLYAADFACHDPSLGGVYRLDEVVVDGLAVCRPTLIAKVARPSSLVFSENGELYVTAFGELAEQATTGKLVHITGEF